MKDWRIEAAAEYLERKAELEKRQGPLIREREKLDQQLTDLQEEIKLLDQAAKTFGINISAQNAEDVRIQHLIEEENNTEERPYYARKIDQTDSLETKNDQYQPSPVRDIALQFIKAHYPAPIKSPDLRIHIEKVLGRRIHEKTAGMTLYRLSKIGKVSRDKQDWVYIPSQTEEEK